MVVRKFVTAVAVSAALVLGTTGCSLSHDIPTLQSYSPSDGADATIDGVKALNLIYLTNWATGANDTEAGAIIGSFVNTTDKPVQLRLQFTEDGSSATDTVLVQKREWMSPVINPGEKFDIGYNENPALATVIVKADGGVAKPGSLVSVWVAVNNGVGVELRVPTLDGTLEQYSALVQNLGVDTSNAGK